MTAGHTAQYLPDTVSHRQTVSTCRSMLRSSSCPLWLQSNCCRVSLPAWYVCALSQSSHAPDRCFYKSTRWCMMFQPTTATATRPCVRVVRHHRPVASSRHQQQARMLAYITAYTVLLRCLRSSGGAAHSFKVGGYTFDAGPSFHMGLSDPPNKSRNPLKQVLDLLDEAVECKTYDQVRYKLC